MFYLELTSGLRRGELLALLWSDIDVANRTISVSKQVIRVNGELKVQPPKTKNAVRKIVLPRETIDLLIAEHERHPDHPLLFPSPKSGTYLDPPAVARKIKTLLKRAGIEEIRFHDLRHTFATLSLQNEVDVKTLSHTLGHYSAGFTLDIYTHVTTQMPEDFWLMPIGLFLVLWACYKQWHGLEKPAREQTIDDVVPLQPTRSPEYIRNISRWCSFPGCEPR